MMKPSIQCVGVGLTALSFMSFISCTEIKDGVNTIDEWDDVQNYTDSLDHPCLLHTEADFEFVREKVNAGSAPWSNAYAHLEESTYAQSTYTPTPVTYLARLDQTNWGSLNDRWTNAGIADLYEDGMWSNYTYLMRDAAAAYQLALRWKISEDDTYADTAINILNEWASTCKGYLTDTSGDFVDPNEYLIAIQVYQLANAAEILRDYDGWSSADFTTFANWMVDVFYSQASNFLSSHGGGDCAFSYWLNWDLAQMTAILSIGILTDDNFKINEAINYFYGGSGPGNIEYAVTEMHQDPDSGETLGQCEESGRDQGHATLCVSLMGVFCQMAKNVGADVFIYDEYRALAMCEYVAKYNIGTSETGSTSSGWNMQNFVYDTSSCPFTTYTNCSIEEDYPSGLTSMSYIEHQSSEDTRGTVRPAWELVRRLANDYGQTCIYTDMWVDVMRTNSDRGLSDGGAGDYGPNSGGFDQLGWGTLMFALN